MPGPTSLPPLAAEVQQIRQLLPAPERQGRQAASRERNVQVLCRFRGQSEAEAQRGGGGVWELGDASVSAQGNGGPLVFNYDRVFGPEARQAEVFASVEPVVRGVLRGVNGAVLCYGQTSAGKTFTMEGAAGGDDELAGVIPRALGTLFAAAKGEEEEGTGAFRLTLSMLEVYMERLRDLLDPESEAELRIQEDRTKGVQVCGLREVQVKTLQAALEVFQSGQRNRCVAATGMNDRSSRSHSVFMLRVDWPGSRRHGAKLYLVDLAGSECLKKACFRGGDDTTAANAEIVEEAKAINQSLTTLGMVISRLADKRRAGAEQHVPYRSSKLTRVLQDALGGNSHTVLVVNCAPSSMHAPETLSTLRFGARARSVVNHVNGSPAGEDSLLLQTLRAARAEIQRLRTAANAAGVAAPDGAGGVVAGSWSMVSALTPCSEGPPSPLEVSPCPRRVSRGGYPRLSSLWEREAGRSLSPIDSRRSANALSPLQLSPRRSLASCAAASRRASRVSRTAPWSRHGSRRVSRVSLAMTEDHDPRDGDLSPLELSPGTSVVVSRRVSRCGLRLSRPGPASEGCTPRDEEEDDDEEGGLEQTALSALSQTKRSATELSPVPPIRESLVGGFDAGVRYWEYPMTRQEKFERLLLVRDKEVDGLQEQLEQERTKNVRKLLHLEDQLTALQTENEWLTADRMQHIEQVVRSSLGPESDESPEGENQLWDTCMEEPFGSDEDASPSNAGAAAGPERAAGQPGSMKRAELQEALLREQQRCAELLREHEAALAEGRESLAEIKNAHEAAMSREEHNLAQLRSKHEAALAQEREQHALLQSVHEAALAKEQERNSQLLSAHEAALAKEKEGRAQLESSWEASLSREKASRMELEGKLQAALAREKESMANLESQLQAALAKEKQGRANLESQLQAGQDTKAQEEERRLKVEGQMQAALAREVESRVKVENQLQAMLADEKENREKVERQLQATLAEERESRALLQSQLQAAKAKESECQARLESQLKAAAAQEKEVKAQLESSLEAALAEERASKALLESQLQAAKAKESECRARLESQLQAAAAQEKESKAQLESSLEAALAKEKDSKAHLENFEAALAKERQGKVEAERSLQAALEQEKENKAQLQSSLEAALLKEREGRAQLESQLQAQLSSALSAGESAQEEMARLQGELFVAAQARALTAQRAAQAEQNLQEESSAASAERERAQDGLNKAKLAEERASQASAAALVERAAELQKAQALQAEAEERANALEAALKDECDCRLQLQRAHEALDAVHRDLEDQLRSAADSRAILRQETRAAEELCKKAVSEKALAQASRQQRLLHIFAWFATLVVALLLGGYAGRAH